MIDIENAKKEFLKYITKFDSNDSGIQRKIDHSFRVMEMTQITCDALKLNEHDTKLSLLIALLHDIGRFTQQILTKSMNDYRTKIDHANLGVEILKKDDYMKKYIQNKNDIETLLIAIKNHNKFAIEENLTERQQLFCKIIRDSDKLDILFEATNLFWIDKENEICTEHISEPILNNFFNYNLINSKYVNNTIADIIRTISFIYDINFKKTYEIIKEKDYIDTILNRFEFEADITKANILQINQFASKYVDNKLLELNS